MKESLLKCDFKEIMSHKISNSPNKWSYSQLIKYLLFISNVTFSISFYIYLQYQILDFAVFLVKSDKISQNHNSIELFSSFRVFLFCCFIISIRSRKLLQPRILGSSKVYIQLVVNMSLYYKNEFNVTFPSLSNVVNFSAPLNSF